MLQYAFEPVTASQSTKVIDLRYLSNPKRLKNVNQCEPDPCHAFMGIGGHQFEVDGTLAHWGERNGTRVVPFLPQTPSPVMTEPKWGGESVRSFRRDQRTLDDGVTVSASVFEGMIHKRPKETGGSKNDVLINDGR